MKILKYDLEGTKVTIPAGAQPLSVRYQESDFGVGIKLWCLVDPTVTQEKSYDFKIIPTGVDIPKEVLGNQFFFGTVETSLGEMLHVTLDNKMLGV